MMIKCMYYRILKTSPQQSLPRDPEIKYSFFSDVCAHVYAWFYMLGSHVYSYI